MKTFILLILLSINLVGQEIGVAFDGVGRVTDKKTFLPFPFSGLNVFGNAEIIHGVQIEGRIGYQLMEEYAGLDVSIYLLYKVLPPLYIIGGINYHANNGSDHISGGSVTKSIVMPGIGAGVNIFSFFSIELIYHALLKEEFWQGFRVESFYEGEHYEKEYLHGVIKSNLKFRFQL